MEDQAMASSSYRPHIKLTAERGVYLVESGRHPGEYHKTTASRCTCPARKPCRHMRLAAGMDAMRTHAAAQVTAAAPAAVRATRLEESAGFQALAECFV